MNRWLVLCLSLIVAVALGGVADVAATGKTDKAPAKAETSAGAKSDAKKGPLDINTASVEELQTLPGIGDAYSKKIVDHRPYKRKDEIVKKAGVPQATYDKIKDQIIAKQSTEQKK